MPREQLLLNLKQLHQLLQEEDHPDAETRGLLESVTADIQRTLNSPTSASETKPPESMTEQLRVALLSFEAKHPQVSGLIERISDGLAGMGI